MPEIRFFKDISQADVNLAGGKGASLGEMTQAGIPVPPGFVVFAPAFDRFIEKANLKEEIRARLAEVKIQDVNSVDKASNILRDVIHDVPMPADLIEEIMAAHNELFAPTPSADGHSPSGRGRENLVAVRSSATAEDSQVASWAGELETYLNVTKSELVDKVKQCWSSLFTPRAIFYRQEKNLIDHDVKVAVVVQKMIQSEVSGVAFTVHPVTEDRNQMIIEACFGLGEALVSGQVTPDSYVVAKSDMSILDINVGQQAKKLTRKEGLRWLERALDGERANGKVIRGQEEGEERRNVWMELGEEGSRQKLSGRQIIELSKICQKIEAHYGFPCDIEWAYARSLDRVPTDSVGKGKFYITQSRPITTLKR